MNKRQKKKQANTMKVRDVAKTMQEPSNTDVLGSYTGTPQDGERPVQDADDL